MVEKKLRDPSAAEYMKTIMIQLSKAETDATDFQYFIFPNRNIITLCTISQSSHYHLSIRSLRHTVAADLTDQILCVCAVKLDISNHTTYFMI